MDNEDVMGGGMGIADAYGDPFAVEFGQELPGAPQVPFGAPGREADLTMPGAYAGMPTYADTAAIADGAAQNAAYEARVRRRLEGLNAVALMGVSEDSGELARLREREGYGYYRFAPDDEEMLALYGRDYLEAVENPGEPMAVAERMIEGVADANMRQVYRQKFDFARRQGGDTADTYYALVGEMARDGFRGQYRRRQDEIKAMQDTHAQEVQRAIDYVAGREVMSVRDEDGDGMPDVAKVLNWDGSARDAHDVRSLMEVLRGFYKEAQKESSSGALVGLEHLQGMVLDTVTNEDGTLNRQRWQLFQVAMKLMADEESGGDGFGAAHRFSSSLQKMLVDWGNAERHGAMSRDVRRADEAITTAVALGLLPADDPYYQVFAERRRVAREAGMQHDGSLVDLVRPRKSDAEASLLESVRRAHGSRAVALIGKRDPLDDLGWAKRYMERNGGTLGRLEESSRKVAGFMRAMVNEAERIPDEVAWYKAAWLKAGEMAPATMMLAMPGAAPTALASAAQFVSMQESGMNQLVYEGLDMDSARNRAAFDAGAQAAVELLPLSAVGGMGANRLISLATKGRRPGIFARSAARWSSRPGRAIALELGAGFVDEALVEPTAQGLLTYMGDRAMDYMGVEHGATRSWAESFSELRETWSDPGTLAAIGMFSMGVTGAQVPGIMRRSREFSEFMRRAAKVRGVWQAQGLSDKDVEAVMASHDPLEEGRARLSAALAKDSEAVRRRVARNNERLAKEGFALSLTGLSGSHSMEASQALAAVWNEMAEQGFLPHVERIGDAGGEEMYRITERASGGDGEAKEVELNATDASNYLMTKILEADSRQLRANQQTVFEMMSEHSGQLQGEAMARSLDEVGGALGISMETMESLPDGVGDKAAAQGGLAYADFVRMARKLERFKGSDEAFRERAAVAGLSPELAGTRAFRLRSSTAADATILYARGLVTELELLEEVTEIRADAPIRTRALEILESGDVHGFAEAQVQAVRELGVLVRDGRELLMAIEPGLKISKVDDVGDYMQVTEAMSDMARARSLMSPALPAWMGELQGIIGGAVQQTADAIRLAEAMKKASAGGDPAWERLESLFRSMDVPVRDMFREATMDARVAETVKLARSRVRQQAVAVTAAEVQERQEEAAEEDARLDAMEEHEAEVRGVVAPTAGQEGAVRLATYPQARAPEGMLGVFEGDACTYHVAADCYNGFVPVASLRDSKEVQQVKAGAKGRHGVTNPLVGAYNEHAPAIFVWRRKDGSLEVISGRHRYALALETGTKLIECRVYNESDVHDAKWARMLDYENNMRDDQADEMTAALYIREYGYDDATLLRKGLLRNKSRSKRGILIGRMARQELWERFVNGKVDAMQAEMVCLMTQGVRDEVKADGIQRRCCMLLEQRRSPEYISAMVQLMMSRELTPMQQGLLDLGGDFEADMARAAEYVEKNVGILKEAINLIKQGKKLTGNKTAERLGQFASRSASSDEMARDLAEMLVRFQNIGAYPELVAAASMWDGRSELDPVGMALDREDGEAARAAAEAGMSREEWEEAQRALAAKRTAEQATGTFGFSVVKVQQLGGAAEAKRILKPVQGKTFRNGASGIEARVTSQTLGKTHSAQMSVANMRALGYSDDEARRIHYSAVAHIHELFERAEHWFFEDNYDVGQKAGRKGAYHFFGMVEVDGFGEFNANVSVVAPTDPSFDNRIFTLELTIENPTEARQDSLSQRGLSNSSVGSSEVRVAAYRSFVEKEKLAIRKKYEDNGTLWLAPNGEPSNLSESQWLTVRTQAFKAWFGDWENDPANASKMLDMNGEPIVAYHGTAADFTAFDKNAYNVHDAGFFGQGIYFAFYRADGIAPQTAKGEAAYYGSRIIDAFLNIRNPFNFRPLVTFKGEYGSGFHDGLIFMYNLAKQFPELEGKLEMPEGMSFKEYTDLVESVEDKLVVQVYNKGMDSECYYVEYWDGEYEEWDGHKYKKTEPIYRDFKTAEEAEKAKANAVFEALDKVHDIYFRESPKSIMMDYPEITKAIKARGYDGILQSEHGDEAVIFEPEQVKSATDNRGTFDPLNPDINFSVVPLTEMSRLALMRRPDDVEAQDLIGRWDRQIELIDAAAVGGRDGSAQFAALLALLDSTRQVLPPEFAKLGRLHMLMRWATVYAHMVSAGEVKRDALLKGAIFEKFVAAMQRKVVGRRAMGVSEAEAREVLREIGEARMGDAMARVARECRERLDMFVKARARERIELVARRAYPGKAKSGKSLRGRMDTAHYLAMNAMLEWMDKPAQEVQERVEQLRAGIDSLDLGGDGARDDGWRASLEDELRIVQFYGDWRGMSATRATQAAEDFVRFVLEGRHAWEERMAQERARYARQRSLVSFGKKDDAQARMDEKGGVDRFSRAFRGVANNLMNYSQLHLSMRGVLGDELLDEKLGQICHAEAAMSKAGHAMNAAFARAIEMATGIADEKGQVGWANEFAAIRPTTGIRLSQVDGRRAVSMPYEEALRWARMDDGDRRALGREGAGVPDDETVEALRAGVRATEAKWRRQDAAREAKRKKPLTPEEKRVRDARLAERRKGYKVNAVAKYRGEEIELRTSRDSALNAILTLEQRDYWHLIDNEGLPLLDASGNRVHDVDDPAFDVRRTLKPLYDFVGKDGLAFGYALRRYVGETGRLMQAVYEERMGVPLDMRPDYWRGHFDMTREDVTMSLSDWHRSGVVSSMAYGNLISRVHHYERLDWNDTASAMFAITVSTQNSYTYMSQVCYDWRRLLGDKKFAMRFRTELGEEKYAALRDWLALLETAAFTDSASLLAFNDMADRFSRALALVHLAGNATVIMKQVSGILHGLTGGYVPRAVIEKSDAGLKLAWRHVGWKEFAASAARVSRGEGAIGWDELRQSGFFRARESAPHRRVGARMRSEHGRKVHYGANAATDFMMEGIELADMASNMAGMLALADAAYRDMKRLNDDGGLGMSDAELKEVALESVGRALQLSASPKGVASRSLYGARRGAMVRVLFAFRSEIINKIGLAIARISSGEAVSAAGCYMAFGALNAAVAMFLQWFYMDGEEEKRRGKQEPWEPLVRFMLNTAFADLSAVPVAGDALKELTSAATGDYMPSRSPFSSYFNPMEVYTISRRLVTGKKGRREMDWNDYVQQADKLVRWAGIFSAPFQRGLTWAELVLSASAVTTAGRSVADAVEAVGNKVE